MYTTNPDGVRIHYQIEGDAGHPCMMMVHGFYGSLADWYDYGYVDQLTKHFRLVMLDVRGHGQSDKPHDPAMYTLEKRSADIICVLKALDMDRVHYYGYSMGGWIAYGLMRTCPDRFRSFTLTASHPFFVDLSTWEDDILSIESWVDRLEITPAHRLRFLANDRQALLAASAHNREDNSSVLEGLTVPCLFLYGSEDRLKPQVEKLIGIQSGIRQQELPGLNHVSSLTRADIFCPILIQHIIG